MKIRTATIQDAQAICSIYNYYIENTVVTFEEEGVSAKEMAKRISTVSSKYPFLAAEHENTVIGYAYATEWKNRSAYRFSAEITIYLDHEMKGKGIGSLLFSALLDQLRKTNLHALVGGIALPNSASVALHEKYGFKKIAQFEEVGFKFNQWVDVGYWELKLSN